MEFSANTFLDVYQGHIDTLHHIWDNRTSAFHVMGDVPVTGIPIANINLEEIED